MQLRKTDLFTFIHKALRSLLYNACSNLQKADFGNMDESLTLIYNLENDLGLLHEHAEHEDNIIFPEVEEDEPEMIKMLENEHKQIDLIIKEIHVLINHISNELDNEKRIELGNELNSLFNYFAATYLAHMNHEETTVLHASMKYLTNEELIGLRTKIQTLIPPDRYRIWLNWMLTSLNNNELTALLSGMKKGAPSHIYENVVSTAQTLIESNRWNNIKSKILFA